MMHLKLLQTPRLLRHSPDLVPQCGKVSAAIQCFRNHTPSCGCTFLCYIPLKTNAGNWSDWSQTDGWSPELVAFSPPFPSRGLYARSIDLLAEKTGGGSCSLGSFTCFAMASASIWSVEIQHPPRFPDHNLACGSEHGASIGFVVCS